MRYLFLVEPTKTEPSSTSYEKFVVCARTSAEAGTFHPDGKTKWPWPIVDVKPYATWEDTPETVKVSLLGQALPGVQIGVIVSSSYGI